MKTNTAAFRRPDVPVTWTHNITPPPEPTEDLLAFAASIIAPNLSEVLEELRNLAKASDAATGTPRWILFIEQRGRCAICNGEHHRGWKHGSLVLDHDHGTRRIRGLLCGRCNIDEPSENSAEYVAYLRNPPARNRWLYPKNANRSATDKPRRRDLNQQRTASDLNNIAFRGTSNGAWKKRLMEALTHSYGYDQAIAEFKRLETCAFIANQTQWKKFVRGNAGSPSQSVFDRSYYGGFVGGVAERLGVATEIPNARRGTVDTPAYEAGRKAGQTVTLKIRVTENQQSATS